MIRQWRCTCSCHQGLKRFADWVPELPDNISPMDLDFLLHVNGQLLVAEFKRGTEKSSRGQRWALETLYKHRATVLEARLLDSGEVYICQPPEWSQRSAGTAKDLGLEIKKWCDESKKEEPKRLG